MRPYYLDGDLTDFDYIPLRRCGLHRSGDTRFSAAAYRWRLMWLLCSFQGPSRGISPADGGFMRARSMRVCPTTGGRRSLKTQQHAGVVYGLALNRTPSSQEISSRVSTQPGSVDMLGPSVCHRQDLKTHE
jgi:hypothetical protein